MSEYTVNDVVKAALEKDMLALKDAVGTHLNDRAAEAISNMYPDVAASMMGQSNPEVDDYVADDPEVDQQDDADLEVEADELLSDVDAEELQIDDSEEETDEDVQ
jgi:hypothetical protein